MIRLRAAVLVWPLCLAVLCSLAPANDPLLVFVSYDSGETGTHRQHLHTASPATPRQTTELLALPAPTATTRGTTRFDIGRNHIHQNRWLITGNGDIIDLIQKKTVVQTHDRFIHATADSLIFHTNDITRGKYYSVFHTRTGEYAQVTKPGWKALPGRDAEPDCSATPFRIYEYHPSSPKTELIADAGCGEDLSLQPGAKPSCPIWWLNQNEFIFPRFSEAGKTLEIMRFNAGTLQKTVLGTMKEVPASKLPFRFLQGENNQLLLYCGKGWFEINTTENTLAAQPRLNLGNDFSVSLETDPMKGNPIYYRSQTIGTYFCDPEMIYTAPGAIAFCADHVIGGQRFRKGIATWTFSTGMWKWVGDGDVAAVCGWTN
ncbi:MAG: hypothetical protein MUC87_19150 [Bacteroidia bacterium]|jgi:hypothetical protein|nr:hypothetical protein [Bacteroidia bacterium]